MTAMLDRPAPAAGLPVPQTPARGVHVVDTPGVYQQVSALLVDDWDELLDPRPIVDEEVVARIIARAEGRWTPPIPKPTDEERIAVARHFIEHGQGSTRIAKALRTNGTIARRLAETVRLDQVLDEVETWS